MFTHDDNTADDLTIAPTQIGDIYFHGGHWGQCLELVSHLCQYGDSIILVSGPAGIGKTTLKEALLKNCADRCNFCEVEASANLTSDELQSTIDEEFAAVSATSVRGEERVLVLLIDDTEKLDLNVLSTILQLKTANILPWRLHIVLFADTQLETKIMRSPLKGRFAELVHTIELETLTLAEAEGFLAFLWRAQGNTTELPLDKTACKKIYTNSNGIPGKVQELAQTFLTGTEVKKINISTKRLSPFSVGLTVSFGLLFCILAFLWPSSEPETMAQTELQALPTPIADTTPVTTADISADAIPDISTDLQSMPQEPQVQVQQIQALEIQPLQDPQAVVQQETTNTAEVEQHEYDSYAEKIARLESKLLALQQQVEQEQGARQLAEQKVAAVLQNERKSAMPKPAASKPAVKPGKYSEKTSSLRNKDEQYLLGLPTQHYTLQLIASSKEHKIKEFIAQNKLADKAKCFRSTYKGKPWHIVVYGNYATRGEAVTALAQLSPRVKQARPWPREISTVHSTIKKQ